LTNLRCQVILTDMDIDELFEKDMDELLLWKVYLARRKARGAKEQAEAAGDPAGVRAAEETLAALPVVGPLQGLRANDGLTSRLGVQRWIAVREAEEQGVPSEQIGAGLAQARESARSFIQRRIAEQRPASK
jgi:hypothetical protein